MAKKITIIAFIFANLCTIGWAALAVDKDSVAAGSSVQMRGESVPLYEGYLRVGDDFLKIVKATDIGFTFNNRVTIVSIVPSIDTKVCELQTHTLGDYKALLPSVDVVTISRDLPFAQSRFAKESKLKRVQFVSDYKTGAFGKATGLMMKERELLARSLIVIDQQGIVRYIQVVPEESHLPDIARAVSIANQLAKPVNNK